MKIGLCAWSFTASHRDAGLSPDPLEPEGLAELARSRGLHSVEGASARLLSLLPRALCQPRRSRYWSVALSAATGVSRVPIPPAKFMRTTSPTCRPPARSASAKTMGVPQ